ncbi:MAG: hypothetical protein ACK4P2_11105 [Hyphomonas sp.]
MLKRALLLCLGLWLIAASGLAAHAGPCGMERPAIEAAASAGTHAHCDMMAAPEPAAPDHLDTDTNCCCPAVLTALPSPALPDTAVFVFAQAPGFPLEARAASRTLIPEPRPPKA